MIFPKGKFTVGEKEKHEISFKMDIWWGKFDVLVDGVETPIKGKSIMSGPFSIEVGDKEKHTVTLQIVLAAIYPVFREKKVQILVEGKLLKTF